MLLGKLSTEAHKKMFLNLELCLSEIDGHFDDVEKRLIDQHCLEMGINNNGYQKEKTLDEVTELINSDMSEEERKIIYIELLTVAYIDQEFSSEERKLVDRVQDILKISKEDAEEAEEIVENLIVYVKKLEGFVETYSKKIEDYIS